MTKVSRLFGYKKAADVECAKLKKMLVRGIANVIRNRRGRCSVHFVLLPLVCLYAIATGIAISLVANTLFKNGKVEPGNRVPDNAPWVVCAVDDIGKMHGIYFPHKLCSHIVFSVNTTKATNLISDVEALLKGMLTSTYHGYKFVQRSPNIIVPRCVNES